MSFDLAFHLLNKLEGDIALALSYQAEDVVVLHLLKERLTRPFEVFTLDTGRHFKESLDLHRQIETFFNLTIHRYTPDEHELRSLEADFADEWAMRASLQNRKRCCNVRKVRPLARALAGKTAWVTGLRAAQSVTRENIHVVEYDESFQCLKFNPLAHWSEDAVTDYMNAHSLPNNALYREGFRSIGCAPCTRAIAANEDIRAGRWWWENPEHKECGLHTRKSHG
ncbi:MAG: phosphoadenylyl-sulfate reductase [Burkholderiales bacterium]|jgi:phosphoadenosine phosphosulfate reductase|nr:phosphoadenylyl-sulfate reductase [Burkholderiales bacterium]